MGGVTVTHSFTGPSVKATRKGPCPTCGKTTTRSRTFEGTVSPFNKRPDGTPKSSGEVLADVRAQADAWAPEPDVFEHQKCYDERHAPPVADPAPMDDARRAQALVVRLALADAILWLEQHELPLARLEVNLPWEKAGETLPVAEVVWIQAAEVPLWARALGLTDVPIQDGGHCDYARMRGDAGGLSWRVDAVLYRPEYGDRLGGAPIAWGRLDSGRRSEWGTVGVDEFAAGLARMGVSEVLPAQPGSAS